jgi:hypothetical protein
MTVVSIYRFFEILGSICLVVNSPFLPIKYAQLKTKFWPKTWFLNAGCLGKLQLSRNHSVLKTPENFLASNIFNDLQKLAQPKINDLQTFPEFSVQYETLEGSLPSKVFAYFTPFLPSPPFFKEGQGGI